MPKNTNKSGHSSFKMTCWLNKKLFVSDTNVTIRVYFVTLHMQNPQHGLQRGNTAATTKDRDDATDASHRGGHTKREKRHS